MTRRIARELALKTLFSVEIGHNEAGDALAQTLQEPDAGGEAGFIEDLVRGTIEHGDELNVAIAPLLEGWTLERLPTIDRLLLRMALYEMRFRPETPRPVVINEAVELAHRFSTESSGRFINGVLASASRQVA